MEKPNSWRTILPQYQDLSPLTPTRKKNYAQHRSQISELLNSTPTKSSQTPTKSNITPRKVTQRNLPSQENPLVNMSKTPPAQVNAKTPMKNKISKENPLNYKFIPSQSARIIKTKVTESKIACLANSVKEKSPPKVVKIKNSETFLDFLPGAMYKKTHAENRPMVKVFEIKNKCSVEEGRGTNKKIKTNKLFNRFSINDQYS